MSERRVAVHKDIAAPPAAVWNLLADYRVGHPSILPKAYFLGIDVEQGGVGAGTVMRVHMKALGQTRTLRMRAAEPEPGRILEETDLDTGLRTTFTMDPLDGGARCRLEIATFWPPPRGIAARLEGMLARAITPRIYREELANIAARLEGVAVEP